MNIFPQTHSAFLSWSEAIALKMMVQSDGKLRIGKNKLAAIMASEIPNTAPDFNINTLKALLDKQVEPVSPVQKSQQVEISASSDLQAFLECLKIDMTHCVYEFADKIADLIINGMCGESLYDKLNEEDELGELYANHNEINDVTFKLANQLLPELDKERLDDAYTNYVPINPNQTFSYIQYQTVGYAYRELLKDTLYVFLDELAFAYDDMKEPCQMSQKQLAKWICASLDAWKGDEQFNPPAEYRGFEIALDDVLGPQQYEYEVIVRAIVRSEDAFLQEYDTPKEWDGYDYDVEDGDGTLRLSTLVNVVATSAEDAVAAAERDAPSLNLSYDQANVTLWVDNDDPDDVESIRKLPRI